MLWGSFGTVHLITLAIAAAITVGLYFLLKHLPARVRTVLMVVMSCSGLVAVVYNLVAWGSPLEYLPLHMCSISAILLPIAVLSRNKYIGNLLLIWCLGSLLALVFNQGQANYEIPSAAFFIYYIPHVLEFAVMLYLFKFRYIQKDFRTIPISLGLTLGIYSAVHLVNLALNEYYIAHNVTDMYGNVVESNYMFSMTPTTPIFDFFWSIIPYRYWYMYAAVLVLAVYLGAVYSPDIVRAIRAKRKRSTHAKQS